MLIEEIKDGESEFRFEKLYLGDQITRLFIDCPSYITLDHSTRCTPTTDKEIVIVIDVKTCLLYTSDAADE